MKKIKSKTLLFFLAYLISLLLCLGLFLSLMPDVWSKYSNEYTTTGVNSSSFNEQILVAKIPKAQNDTNNLTEFLHFWDLRV